MYKSCFFIVTFLLLITGCRAVRQPVSVNVTDSTRVETRLVEKLVHVLADTVRTTLLITVRDTSGRITPVQFVPATTVSESKRAKVQVSIDETGKVEAEAICKELEEKVYLLETTIYNYRRQVELYEKNDGWLKATVKKLKGWLAIAVGAGIVILAAWLINTFQPVFNVFKTLFKR